MKIAYSQNRVPADPDHVVGKILNEVSSENLRTFVERLSFPRHYFAEHRANRRARDQLLKLAMSFGYEPFLQGDYDNIVMTSAAPANGSFILLGAHYDSVPGTPGADDNASADGASTGPASVSQLMPSFRECRGSGGLFRQLLP